MMLINTARCSLYHDANQYWIMYHDANMAELVNSWLVGILNCSFACCTLLEITLFGNSFHLYNCMKPQCGFVRPPPCINQEPYMVAIVKMSSILSSKIETHNFIIFAYLIVLCHHL